MYAAHDSDNDINSSIQLFFNKKSKQIQNVLMRVTKNIVIFEQTVILLDLIISFERNNSGPNKDTIFAEYLQQFESSF